MAAGELAESVVDERVAGGAGAGEQGDGRARAWTRRTTRRPSRARPRGGRGVRRAAANEDGLLPLDPREAAQGSPSSGSSPAPHGSRGPAARRSARPGSTPPLERAAAPVLPGVTFAPAYGIEDDDPGRGSARRSRRRRGRGRHGRDVPRAAQRRGVRGLRPHAHEPAGRPARGFAAVAAVNPRVVVVLVNGATVVLGDVQAVRPRDRSRAGSAGRPRAARSPTSWSGAVNPSGRLAETIPLRLEDNSSYLNFPGDSRSCATARACSSVIAATTRPRLEVAFPFGFGLSYTTFELSGLAVTTPGTASDGDLTARVA